MPFLIKSVQVDGGSEFMGDFEKACKKMNISLFVLPAYSPQLNGGVERANRTFRYEFYALQDNFVSESNYKNQVQKFTDFYNSVRPHQFRAFDSLSIY
ncbi:MAG: integrase core domain-containing protein [Candidatus Chromulinivorax sp.]